MKKLTAFFTIALLVCIATFVAFPLSRRDARPLPASLPKTGEVS